MEPLESLCRDKVQINGGASGNSMGDMTEGRNFAILEAWKTKNSMRSY